MTKTDQKELEKHKVELQELEAKFPRRDQIKQNQLQTIQKLMKMMNW